ncbi:MAG: type II toxin-antitoxin system RelB/DinJ family antitoxin [Tannerella sp.]|jgi:DNA-damage-inducible protein J|nr:type II toxin-antitoxin system RelB/DinJ family antitoxin [Tannerella sp.]
MANLQIEIDDSLRDEAQFVAAQLGLDVASAVRIFLIQMVKHNGFPFYLTADPFYSAANQQYLKRAIADIEKGANIVQHDLIEE